MPTVKPAGNPACRPRVGGPGFPARLIVIPDAAAFSNHRLRTSENAVWLVTVCATWGNGKVMINEFHHGFGTKRGLLSLLRQFVRTPWGWDLLYLEDIIPERHTPFAEAEREIREKRFEPEREAAFLRWADGLAAQARIWRDDGWLARIEVASPLELR